MFARARYRRHRLRAPASAVVVEEVRAATSALAMPVTIASHSKLQCTHEYRVDSLVTTCAW